MELQQQQHSQNSQYKLDEASAQFYESLRQSTLQHDENERNQIHRQLQQFRSKQKDANVMSPSNPEVDPTQQPIATGKIRVKRPSRDTSGVAVDPLETKTEAVNSVVADPSSTSRDTIGQASAEKIIDGYSSSDEE